MRACPTCGAPAGGASCPYCGSSTAGGSVLAEGSRRLACPRCQEGVALRQVTLDGVAVDACAACSGMWLETGELERLASRELSRQRVGMAGGARGGATPPHRHEVAYLPCPACGTLMNRSNHGRTSGVIIDTCPGHGAWLDGGELEAIRAHVASGGASGSASGGASGGAANSRSEGASSHGAPRGGRPPRITPGSRSGTGGFLDDLFDIFGGGFDPF